jgi:hypothetical protein
MVQLETVEEFRANVRLAKLAKQMLQHWHHEEQTSAPRHLFVASQYLCKAECCLFVRMFLFAPAAEVEIHVHSVSLSDISRARADAKCTS